MWVWEIEENEEVIRMGEKEAVTKKEAEVA